MLSPADQTQRERLGRDLTGCPITPRPVFCNCAGIGHVSLPHSVSPPHFEDHSLSHHLDILPQLEEAVL